MILGSKPRGFKNVNSKSTHLPFRHSRASGNPVLHFLDPAATPLDARFRGHDEVSLRLKACGHADRRGISTIPEGDIEPRRGERLVVEQ